MAKDADIIEIWTQPEAGHDQLIYLTEKSLVVAEVPGGRVAKAVASLNRGRALPDDTEILEIPLKQFVRFTIYRPKQRLVVGYRERGTMPQQKKIAFDDPETMEEVFGAVRKLLGADWSPTVVEHTLKSTAITFGCLIALVGGLGFLLYMATLQAAEGHAAQKGRAAFMGAISEGLANSIGAGGVLIIVLLLVLPLVGWLVFRCFKPPVTDKVELIDWSK